MIEEGLYTKLSGTAGITALVGSRIYSTRLPQGATLPAITFQRISTTRDIHHGGPVQGAEAFFQISCWAATPKAGKEIAAAVRAAVHGVHGTWGTDTVMASKLVNELELPGLDENDFHTALTLSLVYKE